MAFVTALLLAIGLLALQHFIKQSVLSPANLETAGKLQRMFQVSGISGPPELIRPMIPTANPRAPERKNPISGYRKNREPLPCVMTRSDI